MNEFGRGPSKKKGKRKKLQKHNPLKFDSNRPGVKGKMSFKDVSIFSAGGHFVQQSKSVGGIMAENYPKNNRMNFN